MERTKGLGSWHFDGFADEFDAHVREQLPWYELVNDAVRVIATHYIGQEGLVYDLGCSTGNVGRGLQDVLMTRRARLVALDSDKAMIDSYVGPGTPTQADIRFFNYDDFDVAICFLSLMFLHPADAADLLIKLKWRAKLGGAIIVVDKCGCLGGYTGTALHRLGFDQKLSAGASAESVLEKDMSLAGVQRPLTKQVEDRLGDKFFQFGDFAGFVWTKT